MDRPANIAESDKCPEAWKPPRTESWCEYGSDWASVKITWSLTVTADEYEALDELLATC